jgi:hypothetical protein
MILPDELYVCRACGYVYQTVQDICQSCAACSWVVLPRPDRLSRADYNKALIYTLGKVFRLNRQHHARRRS